MRLSAINIFFIFLFFWGCGPYPKDARGTLQKVKNDTLKVGLAVGQDRAFIRNGEPAGKEVELAKAFAQELNTEIEWIVGDESELVPQVEKAEIHLLIGGFTQKSPWKKHLGFTKPYATVGNKKHVLAIPPGENAFLMRLEQFLRQYKKQ